MIVDPETVDPSFNAVMVIVWFELELGCIVKFVSLNSAPDVLLSCPVVTFAVVPVLSNLNTCVLPLIITLIGEEAETLVPLQIAVKPLPSQSLGPKTYEAEGPVVEEFRSVEAQDANVILALSAGSLMAAGLAGALLGFVDPASPLS